jgi:hypothetical protein
LQRLSRSPAQRYFSRLERPVERRDYEPKSTSMTLCVLGDSLRLKITRVVASRLL